MAYDDSRTVDDNAASLFEMVTERFRDEVFSLLAESQDCLEKTGTPGIRPVTERRLLASRAIHRHAVRLRDLVARAISLHAWSTGGITTEQAFSLENRLPFREDGTEPAELSARGLPVRLRVLTERSLALCERARRLEEMLLDLHDIPPGTADASLGQEEAA